MIFVPPPYTQYSFSILSSLLSNGYQGLFPRRLSCQRVKLTTNLNLMPRVKMRGAIPTFLQHVFIALWLVKQWSVFTAWHSVEHRDNLTLLYPPYPLIITIKLVSKIPSRWNSPICGKKFIYFPISKRKV